MEKEIVWFGRKVILACDGKCYKAWGINNRPVGPSDYKKDSELGVAPFNPGTYEGGHAKPINMNFVGNKWCARECERSYIAEIGEPIVLPEF